uniref:Protein-lysine N-methyltransferase n=1 Tax=Thelazia callipaeda TaxID=103827 RepID=A0A0N5CYP5_THECL
LKYCSWIGHYKKELKNFEEFGDDGEIWFGRVTENRLVNYITHDKALSRSSRIIDFGCGNGSLLRALQQKGYYHLSGVDYSEEAILLAKKLAEVKCAEHSDRHINFQVVDLLDESISLGVFNAIVDKGTWDALSLSVDYNCRLKKYKANICKTLDEHGVFIICSCNYTKDELERQFSNKQLKILEEVPCENAIKFGGQKGSATTTLVFQKMPF